MQETFPIEVSEKDRTAIDALVEAQFDASKVTGESAERATRIACLMRLLHALPEESTGDLLVARTMTAVRARRSTPVEISQERRGALGLGLGIRLPELGALAAMVLLGVTLLWPMLVNAKGAAMQYACQDNLASAGVGFASYAQIHRGQMPSAPMKLGDPWWLTGTFDEEGCAQSNSAHLFQLARLGFVPVEELGCAGNSFKCENLDLRTDMDWTNARAVSFSYQNQYTKDRPRYGRGETIAVLADKNPFFNSGRYLFEIGLEKRHEAVSENHASRGGLNALLSDGTVRWLPSPLLNGDNIYHVGDEGLDNYTGLEGPRDHRDSFLVY